MGRALKAGDAEATLLCFNTAMHMEVPLRPNLLSGVLNQCAKAGLMDDCMRVVVEMKRERGGAALLFFSIVLPSVRGVADGGGHEPRGSCFVVAPDKCLTTAGGAWKFFWEVYSHSSDVLWS